MPLSITLTSEQYANAILGLCYAEVKFGESPQSAVMGELVKYISDNVEII